MPGEKAMKTPRLGYRNHCMVSPQPRLKARVVEQTETRRCQGLNAVNMQSNSENGAVMGIPLSSQFR